MRIVTSSLHHSLSFSALITCEHIRRWNCGNHLRIYLSSTYYICILKLKYDFLHSQIITRTYYRHLHIEFSNSLDPNIAIIVINIWHNGSKMILKNVRNEMYIWVWLNCYCQLNVISASLFIWQLCPRAMFIIRIT